MNASRIISNLKRSSCLTSVALLALATTQPVKANPVNGTVVVGTATITAPDPSLLVIDQSTNSAIINWDSFNVGVGETTQFVLPDADSWTLNRVVGSQDPSLIYGAIISNGNLVIVNPDGLFFGAGSTVDVNRLIATTADISNEDFSSGNLTFGIAGNPSASIVNEGNITAADYGLAAFIAPSVRNSGIITARLGAVSLASGNTFTIDPYGDGLIKLAIGDEIAGDVFDISTGQVVSDLVANDGTLSADGGVVAMTAATARVAVNSVINNTGIIEARSVGVQGGRIILGGSTAAVKAPDAPVQTVRVSGNLNATGIDDLFPISDGLTGGHIQVTGEAILATDATIDASGRDGGGTVLIGGDYLGGRIGAQAAVALGVVVEDAPVETASLVVLDDTVLVSANATEVGDGGKIIVWSDGATLTAAEITARGIGDFGDGGFIETSGKNYLSVLTAADASAANGAAGTWLMDPVNVRIVDGLEQNLNITPNSFVGTIPVDGVPTDLYADFYTPVNQFNWVSDGLGGFTRVDSHNSDSLIDAATIEAALNGGTSVFITNTNSLGDGLGSISIEASIYKASGGDALLGFNAIDNIVISSGVDITSSSGRLMLTFASAEGQILGTNIGTIDTNGGVVLLAAKEGANVSAANFVSDFGNPSAIQIDIQNYASSSGAYSLSSGGQGFVNFSYNSTTATFGQNAINLGGNPTELQFIMDHNVVLADGAITDTSQSGILFVFTDPVSTITAAQPGNNVAEINSNGLVAAGSQAGIGGALDVLPVLEVAEAMNPATQCAGITCVPITPVVVPPVLPTVNEVDQVVLTPNLEDQKIRDETDKELVIANLPTPDPLNFDSAYISIFSRFLNVSDEALELALESMLKELSVQNISGSSLEYFINATFGGGSLTGPKGLERIELLADALNDPGFAKQFSQKLGSELGMSILEGAMKQAIVMTISSVLSENYGPEVAGYFEALAPGVDILSASLSGSTVGVAGVAASIWLDNAIEFTKLGVELARAEANGQDYDSRLLDLAALQDSYLQSISFGVVTGSAFPEDQGKHVTPKLQQIMLDNLRAMPEIQSDLVYAKEYLSWVQDGAQAVAEYFILPLSDAIDGVGLESLVTGLPPQFR